MLARTGIANPTGAHMADLVPHGSTILVLLVLALALVLVLMGVRSVPQGYNYTVERFGRYTRTLSPGLSLIVPFIDRDRRQDEHDGAGARRAAQDVITRDNAMVKVDGVVFYQVLDAAKAAYEVTNLDNADPQPDHDQHPHRDGLDGPRRAAVQARRDQRPPAAGGRRGDHRPGASRSRASRSRTSPRPAT